MDKKEIKKNIRQIRNSINYLGKINHKGAVTIANDDLKHYQMLLSCS